LAINSRTFLRLFLAFPAIFPKHLRQFVIVAVQVELKASANPVIVPVEKEVLVFGWCSAVLGEEHSVSLLQDGLIHPCQPGEVGGHLGETANGGIQLSLRDSTTAEESP
jgi:hypothetical protein